MFSHPLSSDCVTDTDIRVRHNINFKMVKNISYYLTDSLTLFLNYREEGIGLYHGKDICLSPLFLWVYRYLISWKRNVFFKVIFVLPLMLMMRTLWAVTQLLLLGFPQAATLLLCQSVGLRGTHRNIPGAYDQRSNCEKYPLPGQMLHTHVPFQANVPHMRI